MPDHEKLYYESQAELANVAEELRKIVLSIQRNMQKSEEEVVSDKGNGEN